MTESRAAAKAGRRAPMSPAKASASPYLDAAFEDGDPALVAAALGDIARAAGMTGVARKAGLGRESLYKALSRDGNPELSTVLRVVDALGLRLKPEAARDKSSG